MSNTSFKDSLIGKMLGGLFNISLPGIWYNNIRALFGKSNMWSDIGNTLSSNPSDIITSFVNQQSQAGPTGKDVWQAERDDTAYTRQVNDMRNAGLNPALLYNSGVSSPEVNTTGSSGNAGSIADLLQLAMMPLQMKLTKAQIENINADSQQKRVNTAGQEISNSWIALLNQAEIDSKNARANYDNAQASVVIDKARAEITNLIESARSESYKRVLMSAQAFLAEASAEKVYALLPFEQALLEAQADYENASAQYTLVQKLYQQNLIDGGYIDACIKSAKANATVDAVEAWLSSDQYDRENENAFQKVMHSIVSGLNVAVKIVSPIKSSRTSSVDVNKTSTSTVNIHKN